jgi:hypothetical protein
MRVLTVYAHHNPRSFCHAVLERFTDGLRDAGHTSDDSVPDDVLAHMDVRRSLLEGAGNPLRRLMMKRWVGEHGDSDIVRKIRALGPPRDVAEQQAKVARAEALAFVAPVYFVGFPAILKGWACSHCGTRASSASNTSTSSPSTAPMRQPGAPTSIGPMRGAANSERIEHASRLRPSVDMDQDRDSFAA